MRRIGVLLVALVAIVASTACSPKEADTFIAVNTLRAGAGLRFLDWNDAVYDKAVAWSEHMADEGKLSHSVLREGVPAGWRALGENVAMASSVEQAIALLEASPPHRANILSTKFTSVAIGVVERGGVVWVTEVFVG